MELLYTLPKPLIKASVLARPSKKIKSPYLADVVLLDTNKEVICHSPALGCSGHIIKDSIVWVLEKEESNTKSSHDLSSNDESSNGNTSKRKSSHEIYLIEEHGLLIGCHPNVANKIAYSLLKKNYVLPNTKDIMSEVSINSSRFDFIAKTNDKMAIIEVKSVCIADYTDGTYNEVQNYMKTNPSEKIAIFPYCTTSGKRKLSHEPLSERALKHVLELTNQVYSKTCVLLFVVQRTDIDKFCVTKLDPTYKEACKKAVDAGVIIKAISVKWDTQCCVYEKELEIVW